MTKLRHAMFLSSSTYKKHVFEGFARLQQNDELVDMTLAAGGHWVKVHRTLVALSSPYFRELLRSMPSQHPVIYITGVSNEALGYILEYIYTGEVEIPVGKVKSFLTTARDLQIVGLNNALPPDDCEIASKDMDTDHILHNSNRIQNEDNYTLQPEEPTIDLTQFGVENENNYCSPASIDEAIPSEETNGLINVNTPGKTINITLNESASNDNNGQNPVAKIEILSNILVNASSDMTMTGQDQLPESYTEALVNLNNQDMAINKTNISVDNSESISQLSNGRDDVPMFEDISESGLMDCDNIATQNTLTQTINLDNREQLREVVEQDTVLYTVSNRGALQLIKNRFMYYCHYKRENGRKRRWRCIDYRDSHCLASIDTVGEQIEKRKHEHCHPNHEEKIQKKIAKSNVKCFPTIELAEARTRQQGRSNVKCVPTIELAEAMMTQQGRSNVKCFPTIELAEARTRQQGRSNVKCVPTIELAEAMMTQQGRSNVECFPTIELAKAMMTQQGSTEDEDLNTCVITDKDN